MASQLPGRSVAVGSPGFLTRFASWIDGNDELLVQVFADSRHHAGTGRMNPARWQLGDKICRSTVGDLDCVEAKLCRGN